MKTCTVCGSPIADANGQLLLCKCWHVQIRYTTISPTSTEGFMTFIKNMREWNVTLYGQKEPVPDAFQNAFKDGELDV